MKLTCDAFELRGAVKTVIQGTGKTDRSITEYILLKTFTINGKTKLMLRSDNDVMSVAVSIDANVIKTGSVCVDAYKLQGFINEIPKGQTLVFELNDTNLELIIKNEAVDAWQVFSLTLKGISPDEFPKQSKLVLGNTIKVNSEDLATAVENTAYASTTNKPNEFTNSVGVYLEEDTLMVIASDKLRTARYAIKTSDGNKIQCNTSCSIPSADVRAALKILSSMDNQEIEVGLNTNASSFVIKGEDLVITIRVTEFKLDMVKKFAAGYLTDLAVMVDTETLKAGIRSALTIAKEGLDAVKIIIEKKEGGNTLTIISATDWGDEFYRVLQAGEFISGEEIVFVANSKYLNDALRTIPTKNVIIKTTEAARTVFIDPAPDETYTQEEIDANQRMAGFGTLQGVKVLEFKEHKDKKDKDKKKKEEKIAS